MTNLKLVGAAVIAASALSSPALAQAVISNPAACETEFASANCENIGAGSPLDPRATGSYHRRTAYRQPAYVAAGVTGAALGTAAAVAATPFNVATAPYRGWRNAYGAYGMYGQPAMYGGGMYGENGWYGDWNTYATRNGIVCRPGTLVKLDDGRQHPCQ
ncbi:hypothetical protein [Bradyrhizobium sp. AS23.2]|uniref:hypothetical protein n=1 Tax=Bradyrhizobium sp. AS23.2 TaxID=1680155 RepID=UPI00093A56E6|nr:hypothetical protein [Bradyrhizobium sp. AS23.2]OKO78018.1 hypothetical protein AC630_20130 [Bradyrhizobium sp. AS23.2]